MRWIASILAVFFVLVFAAACLVAGEKNPSALPVSTSIIVSAMASPTSLPTLTATMPTLETNSALNILGLQDSLAPLYEQVSPGVVAIRVLGLDGQTLGSGFVFDTKGHIVTNYHVVSGQSYVEVTFPSGVKARGRVHGLDAASDLAVLKVDQPEEIFYPLPLGDSDQVKVGQVVMAVGNPFGLEGSLTVGVVSGGGRSLRSMGLKAYSSDYSVGDVIQTDAAINPGNSGGPLLALNGQVIGMNDAVVTSGLERSSSGVGFAISSNMIQHIVPVLIEQGRFDHPYMGIFSLSEMTLLEQETLRLPSALGVYVTGIAADSPAQRAGLRAGSQGTSIKGLRAGGDFIVAVDGRAVKDFGDLTTYLVLNRAPGDTIILTVLRDGALIELELRLERRPSEAQPP